MSRFFISSTGTELGKTLTACLLLRLLVREMKPVEILKPIISGFDKASPESSDTGLLLSAAEKELSPESIDHCSPWRFRAPLAPHLAAAAEGRSIDINALVSFCYTSVKDNPLTLIEGAGGIMAPLSPSITTLDWIKAIDCPVILVAGAYLGSFSHTLTAIETLKAHRVRLAGLLVSAGEEPASTEAEQLATLAKFTDCPLTYLPLLDVPLLPPHDRNRRLDEQLATLVGFTQWAKETGIL